ncbi:DUF2293 domain-containing protein [bacterium]|nr:DUF2293 domain-containing protein [bacterium]
MNTELFSPGPQPGQVRAADGRVLTPPAGWVLVPPGDAALTRRLKAAGPCWLVQEKKGRKLFSQGLWTEAGQVERIREQLERERASESFARKQAAGLERRERAQEAYVEDFQAAVLGFLAFHSRYLELAQEMAEAITKLATPVGSGTVARTQRIPVEERAQAAVIAWMRHQTTGYDNMVIPRVKGKRREVRRMLAARSQQLLLRYRRGEPVAPDCPLQTWARTTDRTGLRS